MSNPLVTIVVPVYNTAGFLPRCVDSLLALDYKNVEIILVDDGSTDNSLELCRSYESDNVKVYTKPNEGLAATRNFGIEKSSPNSQLIAFVDSDDSVECGYISHMLASDSDLVVTSFNHVYNNDFSKRNTHPVEIGEFRDIKNNKSFLRQFENGIMGSTCNKLFRLDIIRDNNIRFKLIRSLEDIDFVVQYLKHCSSVSFIGNADYNYVHRVSSESGRVATDIYDNYLILHEDMLSWFDPALEPEINRFVYPQYFAVTLRFMRKGDLKTPLPYLKNKLVKKAFNAHKCASLPERLFHGLVRHGALRIAKHMFLR